MNRYSISRQDDQPMGFDNFDLNDVQAWCFLDEHRDEAYLYSVVERDEDDEYVCRMNGDEWLNANTVKP